MDNFCFVLFLIFGIFVTTGQSESEHGYSAGNISKKELLDDFSRMLLHMFSDQEERFDARMREFENTMQNVFRDEFVRRIQVIAESLMSSGKTSSTAAPDYVTAPPGPNSNQQQTTIRGGHNCLDWNNSVVTEGTLYHPYSDDFCVSCRCQNGGPFQCLSVMCERPTCSNFKRVERQCCEYVCLNVTSTPGTSSELPNPTTVPISTANPNPPLENQKQPQPEPEIFISGPDVFEEGKTFRLACNYATDDMFTTVDWLKDGVRVRGEDNFARTLLRENGRIISILQRDHARVSDAGSYVCRTDDNNGGFRLVFKTVRVLKVSTTSVPFSTEATVPTSSQPEPEIFISGPDVFEEGKTFRLACNYATDDMFTTIDWLKDGVRVRGEDNFVRTLLRGNGRIISILQRDHARVSDAGAYVCRTEDNYGGSKVVFKTVRVLKVSTTSVPFSTEATTPTSSQPASCSDWNNNVVTHGQRFAPEGSDMCFTCVCSNGQHTACMSVSCSRPECENFEVVEGKCCEFRCIPPTMNELQRDEAVRSHGACSDWNDNTVMDGELYTPAGEDLCLKCTCDSGHPINCRTEDCSPPKCQNYVRHKGECCQFTCLQDSNNQEATNEEKTESRCSDLNNTKINRGETFRPYRDDPCIFCTCEDGNAVFCGSEQCDKPVCLNYTPITGTCCDYTCDTELQPKENLNKDDVNVLTLDTESNPLYFCGEPGCRLEYENFLEDIENGHYLSLSFKTISIDGIIFFTGSLTNSSNYEMIWISNGRIVYSLDLGSGAVDIASQHLYNDDQWHKVTVSKYRNKGVLYIGEEEVHGVTPGDRLFLETPGVSYVGALPENVDTSILPSVVKPFFGCIRQLLYNGNTVGAPAVSMEIQPCLLTEMP